MALVFKNCCFCVDLRTGSLIIGYVNLIGLIWLFFQLTVRLIYFIDDGMIVTITGLDLVLVIIHFTFTVMLLVCIHQNIPRYIYSFVAFNAILLSIDAFFFILNCFMLSYMAADIISEITSMLITAYFLLVIRSYWFKLKAADAAIPNNSNVTTQPTAQVVYLAPGRLGGSGIGAVPRAYPLTGGYSVQMAYPIQGGYPVQGGYPIQQAYQAPHTYPAQGPVAYPTSGTFPAQGIPSAPDYTERPEKHMVY